MWYHFELQRDCMVYATARCCCARSSIFMHVITFFVVRHTVTLHYSCLPLHGPRFLQASARYCISNTTSTVLCGAHCTAPWHRSLIEFRAGLARPGASSPLDTVWSYTVQHARVMNKGIQTTCYSACTQWVCWHRYIDVSTFITVLENRSFWLLFWQMLPKPCVGGVL